MTKELIEILITIFLGGCLAGCISSVTLRCDFNRTETKIVPVNTQTQCSTAPAAK